MLRRMPDQGPHAATAALVQALGDALGDAVRPRRLDEELRAVVTAVRTTFDAAACSFAVVEPDGATLRFVVADGAGADAIVGVTMPVSRGIAGWVAMSGEPIQIGDVATDQRFARDVAESTDYVPTTILAAPVVDAAGDTAGVIEVLDPRAGSREPGRDLAVLGLVATQLASVVRLSALYDALGTGLLRTLADPEGTGQFDEALAAVEDPDAGVALRDLAASFRDIAEAGPATARLGQRVLAEVATFARSTRGRR
jgi:signal transduction protein with GAF and PtsI domain